MKAGFSNIFGTSQYQAKNLTSRRTDGGKNAPWHAIGITISSTTFSPVVQNKNKKNLIVLKSASYSWLAVPEAKKYVVRILHFFFTSRSFGHTIKYASFGSSNFKPLKNSNKIN